MNRIDRLFAILLKISDGKLFQAEKLAKEFELSERTIYCDMSALIQMGIPIRSEAGVGYLVSEALKGKKVTEGSSCKGTAIALLNVLFVFSVIEKIN